MKTHLIATLALAGLMSGAAIAQEATQVKVGMTEEIGEYLTDSEGRAVYAFTTDKPGDSMDAEVSCDSDGCLAAWPLFTATGSVEAIGSADQALVGTLEHEGRTVVTYDGWPLYYFARDEEGEEPSGGEIESFGGKWYLLRPDGTPIE